MDSMEIQLSAQPRCLLLIVSKEDFMRKTEKSYFVILAIIVFSMLAIVLLHRDSLSQACKSKYGEEWNISYSYSKLCYSPTGEVRKP